MSEAQTPMGARVAAAEGAPRGFVNPGGLALYREALSGNAAEFARWRRDPITRKVIAALQDAAVHPPLCVNSDNALLQYGVTQGLSLAFQLCVDPSVLWPGVFGPDTGGPSGVDIPDMDFETSLDAALK